MYMRKVYYNMLPQQSYHFHVRMGKRTLLESANTYATNGHDHLLLFGARTYFGDLGGLWRKNAEEYPRTLARKRIVIPMLKRS